MCVRCLPPVLCLVFLHIHVGVRSCLLILGHAALLAATLLLRDACMRLEGLHISAAASVSACPCCSLCVCLRARLCVLTAASRAVAGADESARLRGDADDDHAARGRDHLCVAAGAAFFAVCMCICVCAGGGAVQRQVCAQEVTCCAAPRARLRRLITCTPAAD
eukprot:5413935-Pleurochrysis_carterae.AAC.2